MDLSQMINDAKKKIVDVLNESHLPIEIIDMLLENVLLTVRTQVMSGNQSENDAKNENISE